MAPSHKFEWILSGIDTKGYNVSQADRATIRRQAMLKASNARRLLGKDGQLNRGQYPVFVGTQDDSSLRPNTLSKRSHNQVEKVSNSHTRQIPPPMPLSEWDRVSLINGLSIFDLPSMIENVGHLALFHNRPDQLVSLLRQWKTSYLNHIPERYGQCLCLDHAVQALVSKVREMLDPFNPVFRMAALQTYGRALRTIEKSITSSDSAVPSDVLCAAELLRLIEVVGMSGGSAWSQHLSGALCIVRIKGPKGFKTEYEKDLLVSLAGSIICEGVARNEPCFLEQRIWQDLLDASAIPGEVLICERSSIYMSLLKKMTRLPRLFARVASVVCYGSRSYGPHVLSLILDVQSFRNGMLQSHEEVKKLCPDPKDGPQSLRDSDLRYELLATTLSTLAMVNRLSGAVGDPEGGILEAQALSYVEDLVKLEAAIITTKGWASFLIRKKVALGISVSSTVDRWDTTPGKLIEKRQFDGWCKALGSNHYAGPITSITKDHIDIDKA